MFSHDGDGDDHGVRRADTARAHTQWQHIVASHEATDMLHREMCLAPNLPSSMVVEIAVEFFTSKAILFRNPKGTLYSRH